MKLIFSLLCAAVVPVFSADKISVLLVDGQNNHNWKETSPVLEAILEDSSTFEVTVATAPPKDGDFSGFKPDFANYDVVVSNYNGDLWPEEVRKAFEEFVGSGGGFVSVHAANNSFAKWEDYNKMIAVGGWNGRDEKSGPMLRVRNGQLVRVRAPGAGGQHGSRHEFVVETVGVPHPITVGLPSRWKHTDDELYGMLRGPAENVTVLASAWSDPATGGTGEHEPILMVVDYGEGRVFHTTLGHHVPSLEGLGFQESFLRGTEWAATGAVKRAAVLPTDLPAEKAVARPVKVNVKADAAPAAASAPTPPVAEKKPAESAANSEFVSLFDGNTLNGWKLLNGTASYEVRNGAIVGTTVEGSPNSFLCTEEEFGDFELHFQVKVDDGLNSGVQIRSRLKTAEDVAAMKNKDEGRFFGPQVEIEKSPGQSGYIYGEATGLGWLSPEPQDEKHAHEHFKNGDWNQYKIVAQGARIQTWINGEKVADLTDEGIFKSHPKGHFGLQVHGIQKGTGPFSVSWKEIKVRGL